MKIHDKIVNPILSRLDSEKWHGNVVDGLTWTEDHVLTRFALSMLAYPKVEDKRLNVEVGGVKFENPVIVGGGWTKNGKALLALWKLDFGGAVVGTVVPKPQEGNPKPRQWFTKEGVGFNSLGFPSKGMEAVVQILEKYKDVPMPLGISLGINKETKENIPESYASVAKESKKFANFFEINISSPNTQGLRDIQKNLNLLKEIILAVREAAPEIPIFIKISPDLKPDEVNKICELVLENNLGGITAVNTTTDPYIKGQYGRWANRNGGISGNSSDYKNLADSITAHIYRESRGKIEQFGGGAINNAQRALERIKAGANAVQIVSAIREKGLTVARDMNGGLLKLIEEEGFKDIKEAVGSEALQYQKYKYQFMGM